MPPIATTPSRMAKPVPANAEPPPAFRTRFGRDEGVTSGLGPMSGASTAVSGLGLGGGVDPLGAGVEGCVGLGAVTTSVSVLQSAADELDAHTVCWPAPAAPAGGRDVRLAVHVWEPPAAATPALHQA